MKLKIVLIDDEPKVLAGIKKVILREESSWVPICFESSVEAYQFLCENSADLIISDIKMPIMNGLELIEKVAQIHSNINAIILSGYADFEYAQKAISLKALEYIVKPPRYKDLLDAIRRVENKIICENQRDVEVKRISEAHKHLTMYATNNAFSNLLINPEYAIPEGNDCFRQDYFLLVFQSSDATFAGNGDPQLAAKIRESIFKYIYEIQGCMIWVGQSSFVSLLNADISTTAFIDHLFDIIRTKFNIVESKTYHASVSALHHMPSEVQQALKECLFAYHFQTNHQDQCISYYSDCFFADIKEENRFNLALLYVELVKRGDEDLKQRSICLDAITDFFEILSKDDRKAFKNKVMDFIVETNALFASEGCSVQILQDSEHLEKAMKAADKEEIKQIFLARTKKIALYYSKGNPQHCRKFVRLIVEDINKNYYNKQIGLKNYAKEFCVNESYLSDLFKSEFGQTFTNYLSQVRINMAKQLLSQFDLKIFEISDMVGYENTKYFNRVFKKLVGCTPSEYQERI